MSTALASVAGMTEAPLNSAEVSEFPFRANVFSLPARRDVRPRASSQLSQAFENDTQIVGNSRALKRVLEAVKKVSPYDSTVLLLGETGTGKELIAKAIHRGSPRCDHSLVRVNCAALPAELIASELFGHEKGAFTGAMQQRIGRFEAANGGTIFLDEIAELSPEIQVSLLRVLQEKEFERVGGNRTIKADVRVIAASNKDLWQEVSEGRFRMDLFYRLNVFPVHVPPLRERVNDIPVLVDYFAARVASRMGKKISQIEKQSLCAMQQYSWPGNIRELQNVIERCVILADGEVLRVDPGMLMPEPQSITIAPVSTNFGSERKVQIEAVLRETRGKVYGPHGAAARLGLPATTLDSQIRSFSINKHRFK
jgi:formate hydrogenlyase transcriptional activator